LGSVIYNVGVVCLGQEIGPIFIRDLPRSRFGVRVWEVMVGTLKTLHALKSRLTNIEHRPILLIVILC